MHWWNSNFKIRRQLIVPAPVFDGDNHCILQLSRGFAKSFKTRTDLQDVELLYHDSSLDVWSVLPSHVEIKTDSTTDIGFLNVEFVRQLNVNTVSSDYYLYMTNQSLLGINYYRPLIPKEQGFYIKPGVPGAYYTSTTDTTSSAPIPLYPGTNGSTIFYSQEAILGEAARFTTSKPTEDWINGLAQRQGATASFVYSGGGCVLRYQSGPDRGILRITKNDGSVVDLNTYSSSLKYNLYYFKDEIISDYGFTHTFEVTGDKSPSSSNYWIVIDKMLYTQYDLVTVGSENINQTTSANRYVIGV